ncbi:hypothetical protein F442_06038 [Phytophthora nicotianae P10297]|uniref:Uncharacterized protein n=1 Tax=Phytophthora nicotianae P10297 TaxID=1317064 RepID=W2ZLE1_PHYNI|nr:hypothetical protein F442_06038 [Phytophthora nicotianae P10297]
MDRPSRQVRLLSLRSHHRQSTNGQTICIGRVIVTDGIAFCTNANASPSDPHRASLLKSESIILSMVSGRDFLKSKSKKQREKRRVVSNWIANITSTVTYRFV